MAIVWLSQHICYRARIYRVPIVWLSCGYCVAVDGRSLPSQYIVWHRVAIVWLSLDKFTVTVHRVAIGWLSWDKFTVTQKTPVLPYPYLSCADRVFKVACGCRAGYCS